LPPNTHKRIWRQIRFGGVFAAKAFFLSVSRHCYPQLATSLRWNAN